MKPSCQYRQDEEDKVEAKNLNICTATILIFAMISQIISYAAVDQILARTLTPQEQHIYITVSGNAPETAETVQIGQVKRGTTEQIAAAAFEQAGREQEESPSEHMPTGILTAAGGVNWYGPQKETYYNLDMQGVINAAKARGIEGEYFVREDGCKMYRTADGEYIICAANWLVHPYGSTCSSSLGECIVLDTGGFAEFCPEQIDIATTW